MQTIEQSDVTMETIEQSDVTMETGVNAIENLKERIEAAMILGATGDALGYKNGAYEFCRNGPAIIAEVDSFPGGLEALKIDPKNWMISDDTVMTIATAKALLSNWDTPTNLYSNLAKEYIDCLQDMTGRAPGITCQKSASLLKPRLPNGHQIPFNPRGGGCGAAMRSAPIGLLYHRPEDISQLVVVAIESGRMTHYHPTGYLGSLAAALFTSYSIQRKPLKEWGAGLINTLEIAWKYIEESGRDVVDNRKHWDYFKNSWVKYLSKRQISDGKSEPVFPEKFGPVEREQFYKDVSYSGWGGSSGHDAPMIAYDALLGCGGSWEELCKRGMFHGGDSDSTGIIAGTCWGAMNGFNGVPNGHHENVEYRKELQTLATSLYDLAMTPEKISVLGPPEKSNVCSGSSMSQDYSQFFMAAMVLAATGDALGYYNGAFEFCKSGPTILSKVQKMGGLKKITVCKPSWKVSDDTIMTIATSEALVSKSWKTHDTLWPLLAKEYKECMRSMGARAPGLTCMGSVERYNLEDKKKGHHIQFNRYGGGCGAAMRSAPIGLLYYRPEDIENLVAVAIESGRMTHYHPTGYLGSLATALFVAYAMQKKPLKEWGAGLMSTLSIAWRYIEKSGRDVAENKEHWGYFEKAWNDYLTARGIINGKTDPIFPENYDALKRDQFYKSLSYDGWGGASGHDAPMIAYDALLGCGGSWEELCKRGMFHGGDSDSTGIIAGACWGAMNGFDGVFENNYKGVEFQDKLVKLAKQLYEKRQLLD